MKASVAITTLPANGANAAAPPSTSAATAASSNAEARAAEALRHQQSGQTEFDEAVPQCRVEAGAGFGMSAQRLDRHAIRQQAAQRIREQALLLAEGEFHQALATFGSRGRSRPRSEMMFFWMLFDPPPIISPTSYR